MSLATAFLTPLKFTGSPEAAGLLADGRVAPRIPCGSINGRSPKIFAALMHNQKWLITLALPWTFQEG